MENRENQSPDMSKSQSAQQPTGTDKDRGEENRQSTQGGLDQSSSEPSDTGQSDTLTDQAGDVEGQSDFQSNDTEGASATGQANSPGFVGAEGQSDSSSEMVENEQDFTKDGQGSTE
ncbi:MAG: hypothetical protein H0W65_06260 [Sphingomonas sp.]|uniref:hypothetical protein n=1 Tax=Sphingomonas sp. TaxID=28214 RepID=UPI0018591CFC|nr:hypothetical protein [Sphingomonas sp.]MBA3667309.1 hypothetical protein [Sphingomonas sp.]